MRKEQATGQEHLRQIPQTELVAYPSHHDEKYDVRGILQKVKGRAGSFIVEPFANLTAKLPIP